MTENAPFILENQCIARHLEWIGGNLITTALVDKRTGRTWAFVGDQPDVRLSGECSTATAGTVERRRVASTAIAPAHEQVEATYSLGDLHVRRVFRLYDNCPAIACDLYLRGRAAAQHWRSAAATAGEQVNIETLTQANTPLQAPVLDRFVLPSPHVAVRAVRFLDITDRRNTLVFEQPVLPYRQPIYLQGNLLLGRLTLEDAGFFLLKESPCSDTQLANPGCDFVVRGDSVEVVGIGADPHDLREDAWTRCYGCVMGLAGGDETALLQALRHYQHHLRRYDEQRDFQILVNTWGDRSQDSKVNADFAIAEIDASAKFGATHLMLDDGWQTGKTINSATTGGAAGSIDGIWDRPDYWTPHPQRFPAGLEPVVRHARQRGLRLGLWFAPARDHDYANWQRDADVLLGLYRQHAVALFKIDMVDLPTKTAEANFRAFLDRVIDASQGAVSFNLDVTAKRRGGYHMFREYGNLFLENRYTDWSNYYPHWTLRNLWMLARYTPAQFLQIEFVNRWRNAHKYADDDPLSPAKVPFAYCFALTMMAQPLAWFEASNLPAEALDIAPLVKKYRKHAPAMHAGHIFPIGDQPDGTRWTGFQSSSGDRGYLLILREFNPGNRAKVKLWNLAGRTLRCTNALADKARQMQVTVDADGYAEFHLPSPFSFALYQYETEASE
ncbi:MAG: alpha-galactosidase [Phycisphaeraceae bacterium]